MFNPLIDKFPTTYKGYLIRTDFRVGLQLYACYKDKELSDDEKYITMLKLFYGNGIPKDINFAFEGISWFLNLGEKPKKTSAEFGKEVLDFEIDSARIYSGFKSKFGIDLNNERMHWFAFRYLMLELKDCHLSDIIEIRQKKIDKTMSTEQKSMYRKLKREYALHDSNEDNETQKQLLEYLNRSRGV